MTNRDELNALSNKEMAARITKYVMIADVDNPCDVCPSKVFCIKHRNDTAGVKICEDMIADWLRAEEH